jgi:hypothetical protein
MKRVISLDIHHTFAEVVFWDAGQPRRERRIDMTPSGLEQFGRNLGKEDEVVLEASANGVALLRALSPYAARVIMVDSLSSYIAEMTMAHPLQVKATAQAQVHTANARLLLNPNISGSKQLFSYHTKVKHDENDFGDLGYLIKTLLSTEEEKFPLQRALALYCLFVFSIWAPPRQEGQLKAKCGKTAREAARLLCGLFNLAEQSRRQKEQLRVVIPDTAVKDLNQKYFQYNGGFLSLMWTTRADTFFAQVWERYHTQLIMYDVIEFLLMASVNLPKAATTEIAYHALAANVFKRPIEYGVLRKNPIQVGKFRRLLEKAGFIVGDREILTTPNGVREHWKKAPYTILLSYALSRQYWGMEFPLTSFRLVQLIKSAEYHSVKQAFARYSRVSDQLVKYGQKQNESIQRWSKLLINPPVSEFKTLGFTSEQREFVVGLVKTWFKRDIGTPPRDL